MLRYTAMAVLLLSVFSLSVARAQALERPTASLLASLPPAQLDARPSSGTGLIVAGWISTGVGAVNLAAIPVCFAELLRLSVAWRNDAGLVLYRGEL